jgi:hypothetical protein
VVQFPAFCALETATEKSAPATVRPIDTFDDLFMLK